MLINDNNSPLSSVESRTVDSCIMSSQLCIIIYIPPFVCVTSTYQAVSLYWASSPHRVALPCRLTVSPHHVASPWRLTVSPHRVPSACPLTVSPYRVTSPCPLTPSPCPLSVSPQRVPSACRLTVSPHRVPSPLNLTLWFNIFWS